MSKKDFGNTGKRYSTSYRNIPINLVKDFGSSIVYGGRKFFRKKKNFLIKKMDCEVDIFYLSYSCYDGSGEKSHAIRKLLYNNRPVYEESICRACIIGAQPQIYKVSPQQVSRINPHASVTVRNVMKEVKVDSIILKHSTSGFTYKASFFPAVYVLECLMLSIPFTVCDMKVGIYSILVHLRESKRLITVSLNNCFKYINEPICNQLESSIESFQPSKIPLRTGSLMVQPPPPRPYPREIYATSSDFQTQNKKRKLEEVYENVKFEILGILPSAGPLEGDQKSNSRGTEIFFSFSRSDILEMLLSDNETRINFGCLPISRKSRAIKFENYFRKDSILEHNRDIYEACVLTNSFCINILVPPGLCTGFVDVCFSMKGENESQNMAVKKDGYYYYGNEESNNQKEMKGVDIDFDELGNIDEEVVFHEFKDIGTKTFHGMPLFEEEEEQDDVFGRNILFYAVAQNNLNLVKNLVERKKFHVGRIDSLGMKAVDVAWHFNRFEVAKYLMDANMRLSSLKFKRPKHFSSEYIKKETEELEYLSKLVSGKRFLSFKDVSVLGRGFYGSTYKMSIDGLYGIFVLKLYHSNCSEEKCSTMMKKELLDIPYHPNCVMLLSKRNHKNLIQEIDTAKLPDFKENWEKHTLKTCGIIKTPVILMKYYRRDLNSFLKERLENNFPFSNRELIFIAKGLLNGVFHLHKHKIVHRDLHPGNIFINPEMGRIWIGDYGCCLDLKNNDGFKVLRKEAVRIYSNYVFSDYQGAEKFLAPEVRNFGTSNEEFIDFEKNDLYSIGVIINYLINSFPKSSVDSRISKLAGRLLVEDPNERIGYEDSIKFVQKVEGNIDSNYSFAHVTGNVFEQSSKIVSDNLNDNHNLKKLKCRYCKEKVEVSLDEKISHECKGTSKTSSIHKFPFEKMRIYYYEDDFTMKYVSFGNAKKCYKDLFLKGGTFSERFGISEWKKALLMKKKIFLLKND